VNPMAEVVELLASVGGIGLALVATAFTGNWILRPLAREARTLNLPARFTLSDFVWLLLLLQIVLGAVVAIAPPDEENTVPMAILLVFFGGSVTLFWVFGISALSRAGVTQPARRGVFTVFLLPAVLLLLMATGVGFGAVLPMISVLLGSALEAADRGTAAGGLSLGLLAWVLTTWALRKVAEWVLRPTDRRYE